MAERIKAILTYVVPRIIKKKALGVDYVSEIISGRTSINPGSIDQALQELKNVLSYNLRQGTPINLPGIGTFSPSIKLDGKIKVNLKVDKGLTSDLNKVDKGFTGEILHVEELAKNLPVPFRVPFRRTASGGQWSIDWDEN